MYCRSLGSVTVLWNPQQFANATWRSGINTLSKLRRLATFQWDNNDAASGSATGRGFLKQAAVYAGIDTLIGYQIPNVPADSVLLLSHVLHMNGICHVHPIVQLLGKD
jgi:hypothetical protein